MHLEASSLSVALRGRQALSGIDLALRPRRMTVILGPNGAGKTTLLRALAGLVAPTAGSVALDGVPVGRVSLKSRARAIAYLPQGGGVAWPLPVWDVVALGRLPHGEKPGNLPPEGRDAVEAAIGAVGLRGFENRPTTELSGGERARVLLARALATRAPLLLADEPVAALDPRHALVVLDVLKAHARKGGLVVAVMHDLTLAARFADDILLLDQGAKIAHGAPERVLTEERLAETFGIRARVLREDGRLAIIAEGPLPDGSPEP